MPLDLQGPLAGSRVAVAGLLYAGLSLYITGPLVAERTIARSDWDAVCLGLQGISRDGSSLYPSQKLDCKSLLGVLGDGGQALCEAYGNLGLTVLADQARPRVQTPSLDDSLFRCACAASMTLERHRTAFALHAGSARLLTPAPVRNLAGELRTSLRSPPCAGVISNPGRAG